MNAGYFVAVPIALMLTLCSGCTEPNRHAAPGDYIQADFTCRLADGSLVETTLATVAGNEETAKSTIFSLRSNYQPFAFKVPQPPDSLQNKMFDPLEQRIRVAIANQINALTLGKTTTLTLPSTDIDLPPAERYLNMSMVFSMPRMVELSVEQFENFYGDTPRTMGTKVGENSDSPGVIRAVSDETITVYYSAPKGTKVQFAWGFALVHEADADNFEARMDVHVGQLIQRIGGLPGRITAIDEKKFTVDFGQSFAGETLTCDVLARPFDPASTPQDAAIKWIENLDEGLQLARRQGKRAVLFLYSQECPSCQQMLNEVFPSPSLASIRNSFVWMKIDAKQHPELADRFGAQSFPLTLVLNGVGDEIERLPGLQHVALLAHKFDHILTMRRNG